MGDSGLQNTIYTLCIYYIIMGYLHYGVFSADIATQYAAMYILPFKAYGQNFCVFKLWQTQRLVFEFTAQLHESLV